MDSIILLLHLSVMVCVAVSSTEPWTERHLQRQKRDWVVPPKIIKENKDYTQERYIAKIRSDMDEKATLYYALTGPGATEPPFNLFIVEENSGYVKVTGILDREEREEYVLTGIARYRDGRTAEEQIEMTIVVEDENDNPPVFQAIPPAGVKENSTAGTLVVQVNATDRDKPGTDHTKISYTLEQQEPADGATFFYIDRRTGSIYVKEPTLDRERVGSYALTIKAADMGGAPGGLTATTTIQVNVQDINDNVPTLEKDEYSGNIEENTVNVEVMRFKVLDADEPNSDNSAAVFDIISGNDDGTFSIKTDPKTNEGVLMLEKPVDFEANPNINLGLVVDNVAPPAGGEGDGDGGGAGGGAGAGAGAGGGGGPAKRRPKKKKRKSYPVSIKVQNMNEGPAFKPATKPVSVSETPGETPVGEVIAVYKATDPDTGQPADNVIYAKGYDPDNWLSIDPETAEISLNKLPDRESPFLVNGTYVAKILSLTNERPSLTATGTIALQVGDVNDNCPTLTSTLQYECSTTRVVNVTASDVDGEPNGAPLSFSLVPEDTRGDWEIQTLTDSSVSLRSVSPLWPGRYKVTLVIKDQQGLACPEPQHFELLVCTCEEGGTCGPGPLGKGGARGGVVPIGADGKPAALKGTSSTFGTPGISVMILGFLVLLAVIFLLMSCSCGTFQGAFAELPFDTKEHLIPYHTEGQGEDREVPLLSSPVHRTQAGSMQAAPAMWGGNMAAATMMSSNAALYNTMGTLGGRYDYVDNGQAEMYGNQTEMYGDQAEMYGNQAEMYGNQTEMYGNQAEMYAMAMEHEANLRYEGIALPDEFIHQYYTQKAGCITAEDEDIVMTYDFEGQGSPAGSVGCCSLLDADDDLRFLDDLGSKFKTLAEVCSPEPLPTEEPIIISPINTHNVAMFEPEPAARPVYYESKPAAAAVRQSSVGSANIDVNQSSVSHTGFNQSSVSPTGFNQSSVSPTGFNQSSVSVSHTGFNQSSVSHTSFNQSSSNNNNSSSRIVQSNARSPPMSPVSPVPTACLPPGGQTFVLQQQPPVYYTTSAPMLQPMHYIVQPQLQNVVNGNMMQGMFVVNGGPGPQGQTEQYVTNRINVASTSPATEGQGLGSVLLCGGTVGQTVLDGGGQTVLVMGGGGAGGGPAGAPQGIMVAGGGGGIPLAQVGYEQASSPMGFLDGGGSHVILQSPTQMGAVSFSYASVGSAAQPSGPPDAVVGSGYSWGSGQFGRVLPDRAGVEVSVGDSDHRKS